MTEHTLRIILLVISLLLIDLYVLNGLKGIRKWKFLQTRKFVRLYWLFSVFLLADLFFVVFIKMGVMGRVFLITFFFLVFLFKIFYLPVLAVDDVRRWIIYLKNKSNRRGVSH